MDKPDVNIVEETILNVLATVTKTDMNAINLDSPLTEVGMKSIQLISVSSLLEEKLGDAPSFRALMNMETIREIRDFYLN